jgi:hypothetical protein
MKAKPFAGPKVPPAVVLFSRQPGARAASALAAKPHTTPSVRTGAWCDVLSLGARCFVNSCHTAWRVVFAALLLLSSASAALAAPPNASTNQQESSEYQRAIRSALSEFDAGNFPEARALFTQAHELYPNARTYRGLGFVDFELRNYVECVEFLEAALSAKERPLSDTLRRTTEELLQRARGMIVQVHIDVSPPRAEALLDGVPVKLEPGQALMLEVGDHLLEVRALGYLPERRDLRIAGGKDVHVSVGLRAAPPSEPLAGPRQAPAAPEPEPGRDTGSERRWYKSPWLWTAVAIVVVGAGVGTALVLTKHTETRPTNPTPTDHTPPDGVVHALRSW